MNAGRDVERLISGWLAEEAPGRAPDRVLESTADVIDRTKQRRFGAAWREPVTISLRGLALAAALIIVIAAGAAWMGRSTASVGAGPQSPSPGPTTSVPLSTPDVASALAEYRSARNAICEAAVAAPPVPNAELWAPETAYDPNLSAEDRAASIVVGGAIADGIEAWVDQLDALSAPPQIAAEHIASVAHYRDFIVLIRAELVYLADNRVAEARALDEALAPIGEDLQEFERQNALSPCP